MSIHKKRRESDRNKKLEEQFVKADTNSNGKIRPEQMIKIFEANEVSGEYIYLKFIFPLIKISKK